MQNGERPDKVSSRGYLSDAFDQFINSGTCKSSLSAFQNFCNIIGPIPRTHPLYYCEVKPLLSTWKATSLWAKLDKRASHRDYRKQEACRNTRVLIIGAGPCGLRTAIEVAFLGAKAVIVEKRSSFSRNNVLHLWPYLINDLRSLGAKKFYGKFCTGSIDHIGTRQLQLILLKVALLLGVEVHVDVSFEDILEPKSVSDAHSNGWRAKLSPANHVLSEYEFDVLIDAGGKRNTIQGFRRKEFRGKLAIAITANFINRNTQQDARVEEISGVAFIFNQKFFTDLRERTGIDLENIVYYKDETHYFIMTAKKQSLLDKSVLKEDFADTSVLLSPTNVNHDQLLNYAREAADISTNHQLPSLDYAVNHHGQADIAMFDFTSMFAAENASRVIERHGHRLLIGLVGDSLLEPFWPTGSGVARGFLSAFDAAWMIRSWAGGKMTPLQVIADRESYFQYLSQTTPDNLRKKHNQYSIDPETRYPPNSIKFYKPEQCKNLLDTGSVEFSDTILDAPNKRMKQEYIDTYTLLRWCQSLLNTGHYYHVHVTNFTSSWKSGLAFCALIHTFRPDLIDYSSLCEDEIVKNNQMAFYIASQEFNIAPVMTGQDMADCTNPDKLTIVSYLSQFYDVFRNKQPSWVHTNEIQNDKNLENQENEDIKSKQKRTSFLGKFGNRLSRGKRVKKELSDHDKHALEKSFNRGYNRHFKENKTDNNGCIDTPVYRTPGAFDEIKSKLRDLHSGTSHGNDFNINRINAKHEMQSNINIKAMGEMLVSKFRGEETVEKPVIRVRKLSAALKENEICCFCHERVYLMERISTAGYFFHRSCFKCNHCKSSLTLGNCLHDKTSPAPAFYCYRHYGTMFNNSRKRTFLDTDAGDGKPEIPLDYATPVKQAVTDSILGNNHIPDVLSVPDIAFPQEKKTPERVEFDNCADGTIASEEEQTERNYTLSRSYDSLPIEDFNDSDDSNDDEDSDDEDDSDNTDSEDDDDMIMKNKILKTWAATGSAESSDEDTDSSSYSTATASDESDTDRIQSDEEENVEGGSNLQSKNRTTPQPPSPITPPSKSARESFFTSPPEVVRIDPWRALGIRKNESSRGKVENEMHDEISDLQEPGSSNSVRRNSRSSHPMFKKVLELTEQSGDIYPRGIIQDDADVDLDDETLANTKFNQSVEVNEVAAAEGDPHDESRRDASRDVDFSDQSDNFQTPHRSEIFDVSTDDQEFVSFSEESHHYILTENMGHDANNTNVTLTFSEEDTLDNIDFDRNAVTRAMEEFLKEMQNDDHLCNEETYDKQNACERSNIVGGNESTINDGYTIDYPKNIDVRNKPIERICTSRGSESSFTISTPRSSALSDQGSLSSELEFNEDYLQKQDGGVFDADDDERMRIDYHVTLSSILDEELPRDVADKIATGAILSKHEGDVSEKSALAAYDDEISSADTSTDTKTSNGDVCVNNSHDNSIEPRPTADCGSEYSDHDCLETDKSREGFDLCEAVKSVLNSDVPASNKTDIANEPAKWNSKTAQFIANLPSPRKFTIDKTSTNNRTSLGVLSTCTQQDVVSPNANSIAIKNVLTPESPIISDDFTNIKIRENKVKSKFITPRGVFSNITVRNKRYTSVLGRNETNSPNGSLNTKDSTKEQLNNIHNIPFVDESDEEGARVVKSSPNIKAPSEMPSKEPAKQLQYNQTQNEVNFILRDTLRRELRKDTLAEIEKARITARHRARLKSDEELGLGVSPSVVQRCQMLRKSKSEDISCRYEILEDTDKSSSTVNSVANGQFSDTTDITSSKEASSIISSSPIYENVTKVSIDWPDNGESTSDMATSGYLEDSGKAIEDLRDNTVADKLDEDVNIVKVDDADCKGNRDKKKSLLGMFSLNRSSTPDTSAVTESNDLLTHRKKLKQSSKKSKKKSIGKSNHKKSETRINASSNQNQMPYDDALIGTAPKAEEDDFYDSDDSLLYFDTLRKKQSDKTSSPQGTSRRESHKTQRANNRLEKQRERKRLTLAQEIQRHLQEVEVCQKQMEQRGIELEKQFRNSEYGEEDKEVMQEWFDLIHKKNELLRYESELNVQARELELVDRQHRLEQKLRDMHLDDQKSTDVSLEESSILSELIDVVEQRDNLVAKTESERIREKEEDNNLKSKLLAKGFSLSPLNYIEQLRSERKISTPDAAIL